MKKNKEILFFLSADRNKTGEKRCLDYSLLLQGEIFFSIVIILYYILKNFNLNLEID